MYKYVAYDVLIFDLGNTILPISPELTVAAFYKLGFSENILEPSQTMQASLNSYQKGLFSSEQFIELLKLELPEGTTEQDIISAWNTMLLNFPRENLQLLERLGQTHRLILLSNTNALHAKCFESKARLHGISLSSYFADIYYSHELGMSKPDIDIYNYVHKEQALEGKRVLFLDDLAENLVAPKKLGWDVLRVSEEKTILDLE